MQFLFTFNFLKIAAVSALIFIVLDIIWISGVASRMYASQLGYLAQLEDGKVVFNLPVGLAVQALISLGLSVIISIGLQVDPRLGPAVLLGAFTGFVMYCTFDLTNLSFIKGWPVPVTLIDITWGTAQGAMAGGYVFGLWRLFS